MTIVRYNPNRLVSRINRDFESVFDSFFNFPWHRSVNGDFVPRIDITEDKDRMVLKAELPGMDKDAIKVVYEDGVLTISGEKAKKDEGEDVTHVWSETSTGAFSRSLTLPDYVEAKKIKADYRNGVLVLTLPKMEKAKPKEIEVKVN